MQPQKILIVDDEQGIRNLFATALSESGYSVATAADAKEALAEIARQKPSLVILDLLLPEMSGEELCRIIKQDPALRKIPVLVLTGKNDLQSKINCLNIGAEEYLVKPIDVEELVARVRRFLLLVQEWQQASAPEVEQAKPLDPDATWIIHEKTQPTVHVPEGVESAEAVPDSVKLIDPIQQPKSSYGVYRVESLAGAGGMGLVYKAYDEVLDRYVAVKVLSKGWSEAPEFLAQFHREARLIASINHPRIAPIYTFGEQEGESYFALQWCPGGSLADLIKKNGKIELLQAIDYILQCARGLEAAYIKGVVHRDIKPSNIMFDEDQYIKIVDFGLAFHEETDSQKPSGSQPIVGSPAYMAPEQGRGMDTDHRTDIYSLGITFYRALYGRLPFVAKSPQEWVRLHAEAPFPPYDDSGGTIPLKAYEIIARMTQKQPATRYQKYPGLIRDLEQLRNQLYRQRRLKIPQAVRMEPGRPFKGQSFFDVLAALSRQQQTGLLKASWGPLQKKFLIMRQQIVGFESPQADENFWNELVKRNMMKQEFVPDPGADLEEALNRLLFQQACAPEDFKAVYRQMMSQSLLQVFQWPAFEGEFFPALIENEPFSRISISAVLMEAARRIVPYELIRNRVPENQAIFRTPKFAGIVASLNLLKAEHFLVSRVEGENVTVENLQWLTGFSQEQISRTVYALERLGALEYRAPVQRRKRKEKTESKTSATPAIEYFPAESAPTKVPEQQESVEPPSRNVEAATKYYEMAVENFHDGRYWDAERNCARAIKNDPSEGRYHHLLALALTHHPHSFKVAEESFRHAIELDPQDVQFRLDFAKFLKDQQRYEDALEQCDQVLAISHQDPRAKLLREQILSEK